MGKEKHNVLLISAYKGVEVEFIVETIVAKGNYYTLPEVTTRKQKTDDESDKVLFITPYTFLKKAMNNDFIRVVGNGQEMDGILKNAEPQEVEGVEWGQTGTRVIVCDNKDITSLKTLFEEEGNKVKTMLLTLEEDEQKHKLENDWKWSFRKTGRAMILDAGIDHSIYDEVVDGLYEGKIIEALLIN